MAWWSRERHTYRPPPEPSAEEIERARAELRRAAETLAEVESNDEEVTQRSERLERVHKVNHIGPQFWDAMQIQRRKA